MQPNTAATGLSVTGTSGAFALVLAAILKAKGVPLDENTAVALVTVIAVLGHGIVKIVAGIASWAVAMRDAKAEKLCRREVFTDEQRAEMKKTGHVPEGAKP